jgi:hypothetical protein
MMPWNSGWGWEAWLMMAIMLVLIWAAVIVGGIAFTRSPWNASSTAEDSRQDRRRDRS